jgi:hypothetical protein
VVPGSHHCAEASLYEVWTFPTLCLICPEMCQLSPCLCQRELISVKTLLMRDMIQRGWAQPSPAQPSPALPCPASLPSPGVRGRNRLHHFVASTWLSLRDEEKEIRPLGTLSSNFHKDPLSRALLFSSKSDFKT